MKTHLIILLIISYYSCKKADPVDSPRAIISNASSLEEEVNSTISAFDEAYKNDNDSLFNSFISSEILVYGTDPSEVWDYSIFKNHLATMRKNKIPKLQYVKDNSTQISKDGKSACIVRELSWEVFPDNTIRQVIYLEKNENKWQIRTLVISHLLRNESSR